MSSITQLNGCTRTELSQQVIELLKPQLREILNEAIAHQSSDEDLLTSKDVQNLLNISHATLWRKEKEGLIPYSKIGSKKLYKRSDIINVLK